MILRYTWPALLATCLLISGCSQNYQAEREYWKAERVLKSISISEVQAKGTEILNPAADAFQQVADNFPGTPKALEALFAVAKIRTGQKNFESARSTYKTIIQNFSNNANKVVEARQALATLYEVEGNWVDAEKAWWELAENHVLSQKGAYAPVHIIIHYVKNKDTKGAETAYSKVLDFYNRMMKTIGPIQVAAILRNYQALAHLSYGKWQEARSVWLSIPKEFPDSPYSPLAVLTAAEISWKKNDVPEAEKNYKYFVESFPKHALLAKAESQLGILYLGQKNYISAREWINRSIVNAKSDKKGVSELMLLLAKTYVEEQSWGEVDKIYSDILTNYPETPAALQVLVLKAEHLETRGDAPSAQIAYDHALTEIKKISESSNTSPDMRTSAAKLENLIYAKRNEWDKVIANFDKNYLNEKSSSKKGNWLFLKAVVTEQRLKDLNQAMATYEKFMAEFPNHPLNRVAKEKYGQLLKPSSADPQ